MLKKIQEKLAKSFVFWGSLGPAFLLLTIIVFIAQISFGIPTPYYWIGFISSFLIGLFISVISMLEVDSLFLEKKEQMQAYKEEMAHLQASLRLLQISKLEEKERLQNEIQLLRQNSDEDQKNLSQGYEKLFAENNELKSKSHALQTSLEGALEELGKSKQLEYLKKELEEKLQEVKMSSKPNEFDFIIFEHIRDMDQELAVLEQEIIVLHEIISKVTAEKKAVRAKKVKKPEEPSLLAEMLSASKSRDLPQ